MLHPDTLRRPAALHYRQVAAGICTWIQTTCGQQSMACGEVYRTVSQAAQQRPAGRRRQPRRERQRWCLTASGNPPGCGCPSHLCHTPSHPAACNPLQAQLEDLQHSHGLQQRSCSMQLLLLLLLLLRHGTRQAASMRTQPCNIPGKRHEAHLLRDRLIIG